MSGRQRLTAVLVVLSVFCFDLATLRRGHVWGDDFAQYIRQALNLVQGRPLGESGYIYNPHFPEIGPRAYPPLFPILLAPVIKTAGANLAALKAVNLLFFGLALVFIFRLAVFLLPFHYSVAVTALLGFNPYFWDYKDNISSDFPFLFFSFLALWLVFKCEAGKWHDASLAVLAGIAIYLAYAVRSAGAILTPVLFVSCLIRLRRVPRGVWLSIAISVLLIGLHTLVALRDASSYMDSVHLQPIAVLRLFVTNLITYAWLIRTKVWPLDGKYVTAAWFAVILSLILCGYVKRIRHGATILEVFAASYLGMILILPWADLRYMIPLIPLWLLYLVEAVRLHPRVSVALLALLSASGVTGYSALSFRPIPESFNNPDFMAASAFVRDRTPPDAVLICRKPRLSALVTGHRSSAYALHASDEQLWQWFEQIGAEYILTAPELPDDPEHLQPFIQRNRGRFSPVFQSGDFILYQVNP